MPHAAVQRHHLTIDVVEDLHLRRIRSNQQRGDTVDNCLDVAIMDREAGIEVLKQAALAARPGNDWPGHDFSVLAIEEADDPAALARATGPGPMPGAETTCVAALPRCLHASGQRPVLLDADFHHWKVERRFKQATASKPGDVWDGLLQLTERLHLYPVIRRQRAGTITALRGEGRQQSWIAADWFAE